MLAKNEKAVFVRVAQDRLLKALRESLPLHEQNSRIDELVAAIDCLIQVRVDDHA